MDWKEAIQKPNFWQNSDGSPKLREEQIQILSDVDSRYNALPTQSKNEVIDTYKSKVKLRPVISTGKFERDVPEPSFVDELPAIVGGVAGGVRGATAVARTLQSAVVGGAGEAYKQLYQHAKTFPEQNPDAPRTSMESNARIAQAMISQGIGQIGGEGLTRLGAKVLPKIASKYLEPGLIEPGSSLKKFMLPHEEGGIIRRSLGFPAKENATFTLGQQADPLSPVVKLETIVENSMFGGQPIKELKRVQEKAIQDYAQSVSTTVWDGIKSIPPSEQGTVLVKAFQDNIGAFHKAGKVLYDNIDELIALQKPGRIKFIGYVDLTPLNDTVKQFSKNTKILKGLGATESGEKFLKKAMGLQKSMSFGEAQELRSALLAEQRNLTKGEKASFVISKMVDSLDSQMEKTAKNISPEVYTSWRKANDFWKLGKDRYENDFIRGLVDTAVKNKQPELLGKQIFQNTEVGQVDIVKSALGFSKKTGTWANKEGKEAFQSIKAGWFEEMLGKATKMGAGEIDEATKGNVLYDYLRNMGGKSKSWWEGESIKSMFSPQEINLIRNFEIATRVAQRKPAGTGGAMLIQLLQGGAIITSGGYLLSGVIPGLDKNKYNKEAVMTAAATLAIPRVLGKMLVNPRYQKLFIEGLNVNKPLVWPILSKILAGAVETKLEIDRYDKLTSEQQTQNTNQPRMMQ